MGNDIIELLKSKGLSVDEIKAIRPDLYTISKLEELNNSDNVIQYLLLLETPEVKEFIELSTPEVTVVKRIGHSGPKTPMPCQLCKGDSHRISWVAFLLNGVPTWRGTLGKVCPEFPSTTFQISQNSKASAYAALPVSKGQIAGRIKSDPTEEELSEGEN